MKPTSVEFKVTIPKGTNAVEVLYETPYVDIGMQILENMNQCPVETIWKLLKISGEYNTVEKL